MRMVGISTTCAPRLSSSLVSAPAWTRDLVTRTRLPKSGRLSNQRRSSLSAATSPKTATTGGPRPRARPFSITSARVPATVRWRGPVPHSTRAAGVWPGSPSSLSLATTDSRERHPISTTSVPLVRARADQSTSVPGLSGDSEPVTKVTDEATSRWVTGMPA